jgi:hypothetical protein
MRVGGLGGRGLFLGKRLQLIGQRQGLGQFDDLDRLGRINCAWAGMLAVASAMAAMPAMSAERK